MTNEHSESINDALCKDNRRLRAELTACQDERNDAWYTATKITLSVCQHDLDAEKAEVVRLRVVLDETMAKERGRLNALYKDLASDGLSFKQQHMLDGAISALAPATAATALPTSAEILNSFDARDWARSFVKYVKSEPGLPTDEGAMIGWFANALMRGYDEAKGANAAPEEKP